MFFDGAVTRLLRHGKSWPEPEAGLGRIHTEGVSLRCRRDRPAGWGQRCIETGDVASSTCAEWGGGAGRRCCSESPAMGCVWTRTLVASMNTSFTIASPSSVRVQTGHAPTMRSHRCAPEWFSKQLPCSEKNGGDTRIHRNSTTSAAVTTKDQSSASVGVESDDSIEGAGPPSSPSEFDESNAHHRQDLHQSSLPKEDELVKGKGLLIHPLLVK